MKRRLSPLAFVLHGDNQIPGRALLPSVRVKMANNQVALVVAELNNLALAHFIRGDYDEAIVLLRLAFERFTASRKQQPSVLDSTYATIATTDGQNSSKSTAQQPSTLNFRQVGKRKRATTTREELPPIMMYCEEVDSTIQPKMYLPSQTRVEPAFSLSSSPGTAYSMYNRALVLSSDEDDHSFLVTNQHQTSAILLYNLALVHHNIGVHLGVSAALPHALQLYEMSLRALRDGCRLVDVQKLLLAIVNNVGNIYAHLFQFENTQRWQNDLRVLLTLFLSGSSTATRDEDYVFFFLNALLQGKELCLAPAA